VIESGIASGPRGRLGRCLARESTVKACPGGGGRQKLGWLFLDFICGVCYDGGAAAGSGLVAGRSVGASLGARAGAISHVLFEAEKRSSAVHAEGLKSTFGSSFEWRRTPMAATCCIPHRCLGRRRSAGRRGTTPGASGANVLAAVGSRPTKTSSASGWVFGAARVISSAAFRAPGTCEGFATGGCGGGGCVSRQRTTSRRSADALRVIAGGPRPAGAGDSSTYSGGSAKAESTAGAHAPSGVGPRRWLGGGRGFSGPNDHSSEGQGGICPRPMRTLHPEV